MKAWAGDGKEGTVLGNLLTEVHNTGEKVADPVYFGPDI
jgi:hypothetical protein